MKLTPEQKVLQNLLTSALEGGSNYWYGCADVLMPAGSTYQDLRPGGKYADPDDYFHPLEIAPFVPGGALTIQHDDGDGVKRIEITEAKLAKGLALMKEHYPQHYADVLEENDDATTGDVLLQLAAFGEVVYG